MWFLVVLGGKFVQLQFIGTLAAGRWSELRGGCYSEARNVLVQWKNQLGTTGLVSVWRLAASRRGC